MTDYAGDDSARGQLIRIVERVVDSSSFDEESLMFLAGGGRAGELEKALSKVFAGYARRPADAEFVRAQLGDRFVTAKEIADALELYYRADQLQRQEQTLPDPRIIESLKEDGYVLIAGPPVDMTFDTFIQSKLRFYLEELKTRWMDDRLNHKQESWRSDECATCKWYAYRNGIIPRSSNRSYRSQLRIIPDGYRLPTVIELLWGLVAFHGVRKENFLERPYWARTESITGRGISMALSTDDRRGYSIDVFPEIDDCWPLYGVLPIRTFPQQW